MRFHLSDLTRWRLFHADGKSAISAGFACEPSGTRCRIDVAAVVPVVIEVATPYGRFPAGVARPEEGAAQVEFVGHGECSVLLTAPKGAVVAIRRYDESETVEDEGESFTSYDPSNFIDTDVDRIERLMRHNQLVMMAKLEDKFNAQLARVQSMQEAKSNGSEKNPSDEEAPSGASREAPDSLGEGGAARADEVKE